MLFHLWLGAFPGGWVGVDVFFVISGFLITRLIRDEIGARTFSFAGFYTRRARRLFPAFIVTVAVTFAAVMLGGCRTPTRLDDPSGCDYQPTLIS